jgi:hypothetical protein
MPRSKEEFQLQCSCVRWFDLQFPKMSTFLWAVPNGGSRNVMEAVNLKRAGVRRGVPDMMLSMAMGGFHGLFIEFKSKKGKLSEEQEWFFVYHKARGYRCEVVRTFDEFLHIIKSYLILQ